MIGLVGWMFYAGLCIGAAVTFNKVTAKEGESTASRVVTGVFAGIMAPVFIGMLIIAVIYHLNEYLSERHA